MIITRNVNATSLALAISLLTASVARAATESPALPPEGVAVDPAEHEGAKRARPASGSPETSRGVSGRAEEPDASAELAAQTDSGPTGGSFVRIALGGSHLAATFSDDGEKGRLSATGFSLPLSFGFFRRSVAVHFDGSFDAGPAPRLRQGGYTERNKDLSTARYSVGLGVTGYLGRDRAFSLFGGAGFTILMLEANGYSNDIVAAAQGFYGRVGASYDFFRRRPIRAGIVVGLLGAGLRDTFDDLRYRAFGFDVGLSLTRGP